MTTEEANRRGADHAPTLGADRAPRVSVVISVLSASEGSLASAREVVEQFPADSELILVRPAGPRLGGLDQWPTRLRVIEVPGPLDAGGQRRRAAAAATGDWIRFLDVGGAEPVSPGGESGLSWPDRLRARNAGPP